MSAEEKLKKDQKKDQEKKDDGSRHKEAENYDNLKAWQFSIPLTS